MKKHINIPIFIPHLGCPNQCVFCNQRHISGVTQFDPESVIPIIEEAISSSPFATERELAFFGGSFTGIDRNLMIDLLKIGNSYLKQGRIASIRCSTRPDYIDKDILNILKQYGVGTVELGLQSANDSVLQKAKRGHGRDAELRAAELICQSGIKLGGQMMIGLPGSTREAEIATAEFIAAIGCAEARIYPTVVFRDTELCDLTVCGDYKPLTVDEAVSRSADAFAVLMKAGVKVLRVGLCDSENLHSDTTYFAGPNHPAMGELVENEYYCRLLRDRIAEHNVSGKRITVFCAPGHVSKIVGQNKRNKDIILREYGAWGMTVKESQQVPPYSVLLNLEERV